MFASKIKKKPIKRWALRTVYQANSVKRFRKSNKKKGGNLTLPIPKDKDRKGKVNAKWSIGVSDEAWTRNILIGSQVLYQLSY